jgi:uncharacterized membrane protein YesL
LSLFNFNYNKPGPGVNKNEPKKKPFFLFWTLFSRKFFNLMKLNLLFCIPVVGAIFLIDSLSGILPSILIFAPLILISPFIAGLTLVTRNYVREEHAFILSDFIDAFKHNWAAFLINGIICYAAYIILSISISYYWANISVNSLFFIPLSICIGITILFVFAQYYIPIMIVTFDLSFIQIYKNAFIFSILGLWRNLLLTVLLGTISLVLYILILLMPLTLIFSILFAILLLFSFYMFMINFTVYPLIDKMMIQPYQNKQKDEEISGD